MKQSTVGSYSHISKRYHATSVSMRALVGGAVLIGLLFGAVSTYNASALTTVPTKMNFQGRLTDASGNIKPNGTYNMKLRLYTVGSGGSAVWTEDRLVSATQGVTVTNGLFSLKLGDITTLPASLFASGELYLEVELPTPASATTGSPVWTEGAMSPRNQMATSAYAYNAETLDGIDSSAFAQTAANNTFSGTNTFNVLDPNAFLIQNGSALDVFRVDTTSQTVTVGGGPGTSNARVHVEGSASSASMTWTSRTSAADNDWRSVTYGNGTFVAVSMSGTGNRVMTSPDGITWTSRTSAADNDWRSVTYGNGLFVAVAISGTGNRVMTSPDGITWTSRTSAADNFWESVTYGNGLFVAVSQTGTGNRVMTSPDGITWTSRTSAADNGWLSVTYGNGLFVAVSYTGTGNRVMTSPDGITWTSRTSAADNQWRSVTYGNGLFVAVAGSGTGDRVMTSPDGITWTSRTSASDSPWRSVTHANGLFVAVGWSGGGSQVMTSPDGLAWSTRASITTSDWHSVTYASGLFVAVGNQGIGNRVMTSGDTALTARGTVQIVGDITSAGSLTVAGAGSIGGIFSVDTSGAVVRVGPSTEDANATVFVLDSKNTASDPTGVNGASYYNSNLGKFRCYEAGAWKDCDTGGTIASGTTAQRTSSPAEGAQFFDTTIKQMLVYANGKWQADRSNSTKIVSMGATTGCSGSAPVASQNPDGADYVVTSCTSAQTTINSAINALPSGGGTVYLMEGTYIIDGNILPNNNVTIAGAGPSTIIKFKDNIGVAAHGFYAVSKSRMVIRDLKIDGNKANNAGQADNGIYTSSVGSGNGSSAIPGVNVDSVEIVNMAQFGIYLLGTVNSSVTNSSITASANTGIAIDSMTNNTMANNAVMGSGSHGIYVLGGTGGNITSNVIEGSTGSGIMLGGGNRIAITGNTIKSSSDNGIQLAGSNISVTGNTIASNTDAGIYLQGTQQVISGNTIASNGTYGVYLQTTNDNNITGNTIVSNASDGIHAWNSNSRNSITSNIIRDNGGTGAGHGIYLVLLSNYNNVADNIISDTAGTGNAIYIGVDYTTLSNNTYSGTGATTINDTSSTTIYANQADANGNLINRGTNGFAIGGTTASSTLSVQGGYVSQVLPVPALPSGSTQGTSGATSYSYVVTALDGIGETLPSSTRTVPNGNATLTGANFNRITWTRVSGAVSYKIYRTASAGTPATTGLIGTVSAASTLQFDDTGVAATTAVPTTNSTGGASIAGTLQGGSSLTLGTTTVAGSLVVSDGSSNTATISIGSLAGNYTYSLPVTTANDTFCLQTLANCGGSMTVGTYSTTNTAAGGATITGSSIVFQDASATAPGMMGTGAQTFAGNKTFNGSLTVNDVSVSAGKTITMVGGVTSLRPASPAEGMVYFDSTTKQLVTYANGKWQADRDANTKIVAASNSSQAAKDAADYVATGTADQTQINAALTAAAGGTVYLMEGIYTASATIVVPTDTVLAGSGRNTLIRLADIDVTDNLIEDSSSGKITIRDLRIDGQKSLNTAGTQNGIYLNGLGINTQGAVVENVEIYNFRNYGMQVYDSDNGRFNNIWADSNDVGIYVYAFGDRSEFTKITSEQNTSHGISFSNGANNTLSNSISRLNGGYGLYTADDNQTIESSSFISNTSGGMRLNNNNHKITDNVIRSNTGYGIYLDGSDVQINSNEINSNGNTGIYMNLSVGNNKITNNTITSNTGSGIDGSRNNHNMLITGNYVKSNSAWGIELSGYIYQLISNETVNNNTVVSNASGGIQLWSASSSNIVGNKLINNGGATTNNGISIGNGYSGTNNVSNNSITDDSCTTNCYAISINGTENQVSANTIGDGILVDFAGDNIYGRGEILDNGTNTIYVNQRDTNGNLINRGGGGLSVNTTTVTSSLTLQGGLMNTQLPTPAQPKVANAGTAGSTTYGYRVTALDGTGETLPSTERTTTTGNATLNGTNYNVITWSQVQGAVQYKIYRTTSAGTPATTGLIATITGANNVFFNDTGIAAGAAIPASNTTGGITIAGGLAGTTATLSAGITVNGTTSLNNTALLRTNSSTAFQIQNSSNTALLVADTSTMKVTISTLEVTGNLTVNGHIISGGTTPTIAAGAAACTTPTVAVSGNDTAGLITVTTGTSCSSGGGLFATVTFNTAYGSAPRVILTPANDRASSADAYVNESSISTTSYGLTLSSNTFPFDSSVYKWYYQVIQ